MADKLKSSSPKAVEASGSSSSPKTSEQSSGRKAPSTVKRAPAKNTGSPPPMCSVHGPNCPGGHKSKSKR